MQRARVVYEIEQVVKAAATISRRPTVKFGVHPRYPGTTLTVAARGVDIHA